MDSAGHQISGREEGPRMTFLKFSFNSFLVTLLTFPLPACVTFQFKFLQTRGWNPGSFAYESCALPLSHTP